MKRSSQPVLTDSGEAIVTAYTRYLHDEQDVSAGTRRSYLSELRQFAAWCEASWSEGHDTPVAFTPPQITTPLLTQYRSYLQTVRRMQPTTINRSLVGLKCYCAWATEALDRAIRRACSCATMTDRGAACRAAPYAGCWSSEEKKFGVNRLLSCEPRSAVNTRTWYQAAGMRPYSAPISALRNVSIMTPCASPCAANG